MDGHRRRPALLARADRDDPRGVRLHDRGRLLPRGPHPCGVGRERPALPQGEGRRGRALLDHAAVLRQCVLLRLRRTGARDRDRRPDHPRDHADHRLPADQAHDEHVRRHDPGGAAGGARRPRRGPGGGDRLRGRLRDAAVRRAAGQRRAGHPLLHAQPLSGDALDPQRPALHGPVARRGAGLDGQGLRRHRRASARLDRPPGAVLRRHARRWTATGTSTSRRRARSARCACSTSTRSPTST